MSEKSIGFIGGGRITRIILQALKQKNKLPPKVVVSDINPDILEKLKEHYPKISISHADNKPPAKQDYIFISLHPPVLRAALNEIASIVKPPQIIISLAPKFTITKISELLNQHRKIVRMIPNAPAIINSGFNPVFFHQSIDSQEKENLLKFFRVLGDCPIVAEEKLEAYAIIMAMGPTYFWFQFHELYKLGKEFGLDDCEVRGGISKMVSGAAETLFRSGLTYGEVEDLIPVKPLGENDAHIREIYRTKLTALYQKLKS